jgi:serine/threonine protein kinase, bacterial
VDEIAFGRYRLMSLIGEGGMGQVYKAHDTMIGRDVAIKVLSTELAAEPGYRERFRREAHTAARIAEPHIIPIYDTGEIDGRLYLVMPVVEGVDLHALLQRDGPMRPQRAAHVIEQLAGALDAAHAVGLVHRDVKPSNALVTARDFVYLIDFGIAHDSAATKLTRTGTIVGSWAYMAPERFTAGTADARADVYALACVLHECLTGVQPYPGNSLEQQFAGHYSAEPPKPTVLDPAIPAGFDEVIARGMAKDADRRYQSAIDLAVATQRALSPTLSGRPLAPAACDPAPAATRQPSPDVPTARMVAPPASPGGVQRGTFKGPLIVAVVALLAVAGLVGYLLRPQPSEPQTVTAPTSNGSTGTEHAAIRAEVRIYNISSTAGLGSRIADQLKAAGFNVTEVSSLSVTDVLATTVYYSDATGEKETAAAVGKTLGALVERRISAVADQPPGVIVLATG